MPFSPAPFTPTPYTPPDFTLPHLAAAPDVTLVPAPKDFVAPEGYHAMSIYPEYLKIAGQWTLARDSRMDCVAVVEGGNVFVREFRHIRAGDLIACGRTENGEEGILVYTDGFRGLATSEDGAPHPGGHDNFAFRLGRSRETAFSRDYDELYELLRHDRDHGSIVWVMGPAFTFNGYSREAFAKIIDAGYADAVFAGNALATHDLEGAYFHTSLGQDIDTQENRPNGHYHHLDTINRVRYWGSIERFIEEEGVRDGIMNALVRNGVPYVLAGSIRDDGPLPGVYGNAYEAQDAMRDHIRSATTVICMATMLHTIATGNMTPSYRVLADGSPILGVDVDAAGLITLRKMGRPVMPMSVTELETVVRYVHDMGRKFIVKGIMTPDDAHRAIDAGCDAIVVSNHGGRVLDHCPGTATVLPAIADAVRGRITILADGAVRDGVDVLKMLALGADAVLVGRPLCIAAIGGGVEGVTRYWQQMQGQLVQAMLLTGCASLADVREHIIYRG